MSERDYLLRARPLVFDGPPTNYWSAGLNQTLPPAPEKKAPTPEKKATRTCRVCGIDKLVSCFGRSIGYRDGLHRVCKQCRRMQAQRLWVERAKARGTPVHIVAGMASRVRKGSRHMPLPDAPTADVLPQMLLPDHGNTCSQNVLGCASPAPDAPAPATATAINCMKGSEHMQMAQQMRPPFVLDWQQRMASYQFEAAPPDRKRRPRRTKTLQPCQVKGTVTTSSCKYPTEINPKRSGHTAPVIGDLFS